MGKRGIPVPVLVPVHDGREHGVRIGARADEQENDEEQGLEVEESRLPCVSFARGCMQGWRLTIVKAGSCCVRLEL